MSKQTPDRLHWKEWATLIISVVALIATSLSAYFSSQSARAAARSAEVASSLAGLQTKTILIVNCDVGKHGLPDYYLSLSSPSNVQFRETLGYFKPSGTQEYRECLVSNHGAYPVLNLTLSFNYQFEDATPQGNGLDRGKTQVNTTSVTIGEVAPKESASIWVGNEDRCKVVAFVLNQTANLLPFPFDTSTQYQLPGWRQEQIGIRPIDSALYKPSLGRNNRFFKECER